MNPTILLNDYKPRWYQEEFENAMFSGKRRAFLRYHRRAGKDFSCWMFLIYCAIHDRPAAYYYIFPEYAQGKKVIWEGIDESGKRFLDYIPKELLLKKPNSTEMKISVATISGGQSLIQIIGSDNPDSIRGTNPYGVVLSEYAYQSPRIWTEILSPILVKNGGWAIFNTTPNGRNHAYDLWINASSSPDWYTKCLTVEDTGLISKDAIERERREGKSEEMIQQEYYVSWAGVMEGHFYSRVLSECEKDGRIGEVRLDSNHLVYTAWDLGIGDAMSIIFFQVMGDGMINIIDHYENRGYALSHYIEYIRSLKYNYGNHFVPHDGKNRNLITGSTFVDTASQLGIDMTVIPNTKTIQEGIEIVRGTIPRMRFDKVKCDYLLRCLLEYHAEFDDKAKILRKVPAHTWASHAADSMRYLCIAIKDGHITTSTQSAWHAIKEKYNYYGNIKQMSYNDSSRPLQVSIK